MSIGEKAGVQNTSEIQNARSSQIKDGIQMMAQSQTHTNKSMEDPDKGQVKINLGRTFTVLFLVVH